MQGWELKGYTRWRTKSCASEGPLDGPLSIGGKPEPWIHRTQGLALAGEPWASARIECIRRFRSIPSIRPKVKLLLPAALSYSSRSTRRALFFCAAATQYNLTETDKNCPFTVASVCFFAQFSVSADHFDHAEHTCSTPRLNIYRTAIYCLPVSRKSWLFHVFFLLLFFLILQHLYMT